MALDFTPQDVASGYLSADVLDENFTNIETALTDGLSRSGDTPNEMNAVLDMNSNDILNARALNVQSLSINGTQVTAGELPATELPDQSGNSGKYLGTNGTSTSWNVPASSEISHLPQWAGGTSTTVRAKLQERVSIKDFGAVGDGVTDDTTAFITAATALTAIGGGTLYLEADKNYSVWPGSLSTSAILVDLEDLNGVTIEGNGSTLTIGTTSGSAVRTVFALDNVNGFTLRNLIVTGGNTTLASGHGVSLVNAQTGSKNILMENIVQTNGMLGFSAAGWEVSPRVQNITMLNCEFNEVYYPMNFQGTGDNFFARNIKALGCGRCYFPWNVKNHDVQVYSEQQGIFSDVLLKAYGKSGNYNRLENIKLNYSSGGRVTATSNQSADEAMVAIDCQLDPTSGTSVSIANIDITVDVEPRNDTGRWNQSLFTIRKYDSAGAADSTARGHSLTNIKLRGLARSAQNFQDDFVRICTRASEDWTGEFLSNVGLEDLHLPSAGTGTAVAIDVEGASVFGIFLHRVYSEDGLTVDNGTVSNLDISECTFDAVKYNPRMRSYTNAARPAATTYAAGGVIWNTDDNAPNFSDGTDWRDAAGSTT